MSDTIVNTRWANAIEKLSRLKEGQRVIYQEKGKPHAGTSKTPIVTTIERLARDSIFEETVPGHYRFRVTDYGVGRAGWLQGETINRIRFLTEAQYLILTTAKSGEDQVRSTYEALTNGWCFVADDKIDVIKPVKLKPLPVTVIPVDSVKELVLRIAELEARMKVTEKSNADLQTSHTVLLTRNTALQTTVDLLVRAQATAQATVKPQAVVQPQVTTEKPRNGFVTLPVVKPAEIRTTGITAQQDSEISTRLDTLTHQQLIEWRELFWCRQGLQDENPEFVKLQRENLSDPERRPPHVDALYRLAAGTDRLGQDLLQMHEIRDHERLHFGLNPATRRMYFSARKKEKEEREKKDRGPDLDAAAAAI